MGRLKVPGADLETVPRAQALPSQGPARSSHVVNAPGYEPRVGLEERTGEELWLFWGGRIMCE